MLSCTHNKYNNLILSTWNHQICRKLTRGEYRELGLYKYTNIDSNLFISFYGKFSIKLLLYRGPWFCKKRLYNRETNRVFFCVKQQMSVDAELHRHGIAQTRNCTYIFKNVLNLLVCIKLKFFLQFSFLYLINSLGG